MEKYLIARHFINGEQTFQEFKNGVNNLNLGTDISMSHNLGFRFGLKLTVDENKVGRDLVERIKETEIELPKHNFFYMYDPKDRGPGTSFQQILFNRTFSTSGNMVMSFDLDQYIIETHEALGNISEFAERMETEKALYATGSRDVPVLLATNKRNSNLRIIHELFHSLVIGSENLKIFKHMSKVTPAYAEIGESTSGFYILNTAHPSYSILTTRLTEASSQADMKGFVTDYFVAIASSQIATLSRGYVASRENVFYEKKNEEEEFNSVTKLIKKSTKELAKTRINVQMYREIKKEENISKIRFPEEDVRLVRKLMLDALVEQNGTLRCL